VVALWERAVRNGQCLGTVDHSPMQVLYPGRPSDMPGADFQDAVLEIGGRVIKGNIEVHVRAEDWRLHGHHRDAAYNGVVLHVVMWSDGQPRTALENGAAIPVIALDRQARGRTPGGQARAPPLPCRAAAGKHGVLEAIERAGDARFREKAAVLARELGAGDGGQCLYRGIMTALGYSRNQSPFGLLAERLPLVRLTEVTRTGTEPVALTRLEALFMGTAGFLPSQRGNRVAENHPWLDTLEGEWHLSGMDGRIACPAWRLFRVRPGNHPARRLAGMARLLWRYREKGLLGSLTQAMETATPENGGLRLVEFTTVAADGYWTDHCDVGRVCRGLEPFLIGRSRARDIAVNIILPFAAAWSETAARPELAAKAMALYQTCPPGAENAIERHMRAQFGLKRAAVNTARRQQGLLHLYKRFCTQGRCGECALRA